MCHHPTFLPHWSMLTRRMMQKSMQGCCRSRYQESVEVLEWDFIMQECLQPLEVEFIRSFAKILYMLLWQQWPLAWVRIYFDDDLGSEFF